MLVMRAEFSRISNYGRAISSESVSQRPASRPEVEPCPQNATLTACGFSQAPGE